ncbi:MAG TPA: iron-sulfur cluster assembly accessory protein [Methylocystis sp.]|nr:iron-sulfur cluster assembly accessory protein [Methylocystis sp.]
MALPQLLTLSDAAAARVRTLLRNAEPDRGLRVSLEKSGCAGMTYKMAVDAPAAGDEVVEQGGARVIIDAKALLYLIGSRMDVKTENFSSTFVFDNPNQTGACGCGASVALTPAAPGACAKAAEAAAG